MENIRMNITTVVFSAEQMMSKEKAFSLTFDVNFYSVLQEPVFLV